MMEAPLPTVRAELPDTFASVSSSTVDEFPMLNDELSDNTKLSET